MSTHEARLGNLSVAITESAPRNSKADASAEIVIRPLKSRADQAIGGVWSSYHLARCELWLRRNADEFPGGLLSEEAEAAIVDAVKGFFERHRAAEQPATTPPKAPETAAANPDNV